VIIFGPVWFSSKRITKPNLKKKTETEPKPGQTDRFRFGFLVQKPVQTALAQFWLGFFGLARFFRFGLVFSVSVRFGFFSFLLIKPKLN